jgi:hypothetical protein
MKCNFAKCENKMEDILIIRDMNGNETSRLHTCMECFEKCQELYPLHTDGY